MSREVVTLVDVGSTFAKLTAVDGRDGAIVAQARVPTAHVDLLAELLRHADPIDAACSSAGGGLRVAVVGFEPRLTLEAGRRAVLGAGGRVVAAVAGAIDAAGEAALRSADADVILLTGGTDGGDHATIVHNAGVVATVAPAAAVVVAGNADARAAVSVALNGHASVRFAENVLPRVGVLAVDEAQRAIRDLFIDHVIGRGRFPDSAALEPAIRAPTPAAVLAAAELLAEIAGEPVVVVDVGGATTDVHSVLPRERSGPVPHARVTRTVEGDLGLRASAVALVEAAADAGLVSARDADRLGREAALRASAPEFVPAFEDGRRVDEELAGLALTLALARHAGRMTVALEPDGATLRRSGRDLRDARWLVVTGGLFEHAPEPQRLARQAWERARAGGALLSADPRVGVDRRYVLAAAGLLCERRPELARRLLARELIGEAATGG